MNTKAAINGLLVVAMLLGGAWTLPAHAQLVSCSDGQGVIEFEPYITETPKTVQATMSVYYFNCSGSGVTNAEVITTFTMVGATCVNDTDIVLSAWNSGTTTVTWFGGSGPDTTTFNLTLPVLAQLDFGIPTSVGVGLSTGGRFHPTNPLLQVPATLTQMAALTPSALCPYVNSAGVNADQFVLVQLL